jgi:hypothetical protein
VAMGAVMSVVMRDVKRVLGVGRLGASISREFASFGE